MKKKVQIIGKVSGLDLIHAQIKFKVTQAALEKQGYHVINPMQLVPSDAPYIDAMRICLRSLLDVDAICVQDDWIGSTGARAEYLVASVLRLDIIRI